MDPEDRNLYPQSPQSVGRVLDAGFRLFRASFRSVLVLSMTLSTLINLPQVAQLMGSPEQGSTASESLALAFVLVCVPLYLAGYMGMMVALDAVARGAPVPGFKDCFSAGLNRLLTGVGAMALYVVILLFGFLLLVIPGLVLMISMGFSLILIVLERRGAVESLRASHALVWGHWWRTAAVLTVGGLLYYLPSLLVGGVLGFVLAVADGNPVVEGAAEIDPLVMAGVLATQILVAGLMLPLLNAVTLVQFHDLKLRRSGSDLLARASAVG